MIALLAAAVLTSGARLTLTQVDSVERQFRAEGQSHPVVGVFSTRYTWHGRPIDANTFWTSIRPGTVLDVKTRVLPNFSILIASQISVQ